jgi:hypothetical protein
MYTTVKLFARFRFDPRHHQHHYSLGTSCKPGQRDVVIVVMEVKSDSSHFTPDVNPYNTYFTI